MTLVHLQLSNQCTHTFICDLVFTEAAECQNKRERGGSWYFHKRMLHCLVQSPMGTGKTNHLHQGCTWMVWLALCKLHPISVPDHKTVCVSYWVSGNKTSSTPNPNQQSASIYSQPQVLISMPHVSEQNKHRWSDDVDKPLANLHSGGESISYLSVASQLAAA